ncbi:MAG: YceD family protein [Mycobacteriaceae bacterium]
MVSRRNVAPRTEKDAPFVLDTTKLGRRPGSMAVVHREFAAPVRIGLDLIGIEQGSPVVLDIRLEAVSEGVLVSGTFDGPVQGQCSRCLEPLSDTVEIYITELFAYEGSATDATTDEDEIHLVVDDEIELEQVVIDGVALELPLSPTCQEDCLGLCQTCGVVLASAEPNHSHEQLDPRWAVLADKIVTDGSGEK